MSATSSNNNRDSHLDGPSNDVFEFGSRYLVDYIGDTEDVEKYEPGGYHPVHLDDLLEDRYRIVHKLGSGGFSTVWLVEDECKHRKSRWLALKIVVADETDRVKQRYDEIRAALSKMHDVKGIVVGSGHFYVHGPNGRYLCLLMPVLGPSMARLSSGFQSRLHPLAARRAGFKATQVLARLHAVGICHGDATTANFVYAAAELQEYAKGDIYQLLGQPVTSKVEHESGLDMGPWTPCYLVRPLDFLHASQKLFVEEMRLIDFDQCFVNASIPEKKLETPAGFLAPEVAVGGKASPASDIWSLGCTQFRLRSGRGPLAKYEVSSPVELLRVVVQTMGDYPVPSGTFFDDDGQPTQDTADAKPLEERDGERSLQDLVNTIYDCPKDFAERLSHAVSSKQDSIPFSHSKDHNPFPSHLASLVWKPAAVDVDGVFLDNYSDETETALEQLPNIDAEEASALLDLLQQIFVYDSHKRPTAEQILLHPWFEWNLQPLKARV